MFLYGLSRVLLVIAGLAFWAGGKIISETAKIDRLLAEMLGMGLAVAIGALGYIVKTAGEDLDSEKELESHEG
jgi:hypothetical protein